MMTAEDARRAMLGVWQLVEYEDREAETDPWFAPYGTHPLGVFTITRTVSCRSTCIREPTRRRTRSTSGTSDDT